MTKLVVLLAVLVPAVARADAATDLAKDLDVHLSFYETYRDNPGSRASSLATDPTADACDAAVAKAKKAGLKDDARIYSTRFNSWDDAHYDDSKLAYVAVSDLAAMCKAWRLYVLLAPAAAAQTKVADSQYSYSLLEPGDLGASMPPVFLAAGKECLEITDKALKAGAPPNQKVKIRDQTMSITDGRSKVCQAHIDWAIALAEKVKTAHAADREKRAAPYKAAGVGGKKLDLFLEYDDVYWRGGARCEIISDIKALAKAKVLFQWLENPDGTHTIRKYTFNGNAVSGPINKTFKNSAAAAAGCK